jgi:transcriptional regulator with XRE-family HTH domain
VPAPFLQQVLRGPDRAELDDVLGVFGQHVRSLREAAGLSQDQLGARCLLLHGVMSHIEGGSTAPNFPVLLWLARALGVPVGTLTDELAPPSLSVSRGAVLAGLARQPGLTTSELATALELPGTYILRIVHYLEAYGEIARQGGAWTLAPGHTPIAEKG